MFRSFSSAKEALMSSASSNTKLEVRYSGEECSRFALRSICARMARVSNFFPLLSIVSNLIRNSQYVPENATGRNGGTGTGTLYHQGILPIGFRIDLYDRVRPPHLPQGTLPGHGHQFYFQYALVLLQVPVQLPHIPKYMAGLLGPFDILEQGVHFLHTFQKPLQIQGPQSLGDKFLHVQVRKLVLQLQ